MNLQSRVPVQEQVVRVVEAAVQMVPSVSWR